MAVVQVSEDNQGNGGSIDAYTFGTSIRKFKVKVDDPANWDETAIIVAYPPLTGPTSATNPGGGTTTLPAIRDAHPTRIGIYCSGLDAQQVAQGCWEVTATYSKIDPQLLPWNRAPIWSVSIAKFEMPIDEFSSLEGEQAEDTGGDYDDGSTSGDDPDVAQSTLLHNTAGDVFDPAPTKAISMPVLTVVKNLQLWSQVVQWLNMTDSLNNAPWLGWETGRVRVEIAGMTIQGEPNPATGVEVYYYQVTANFYVSTLPWGHKLRLLNAGFNEKKGDGKRGPIYDQRGREITVPTPLDINGVHLPFVGESGFPGTPVWLTYTTHELKNFSVFALSAPSP
ncbi:MAG TPA: hypothetical protein VG713_15270 [Pirellulales bacterium]|nr:hypothetical protein [Pirellulales bacterium]